MATDVEKLVVQLSADIKGYQREMQKAADIADSQARAIEKRYQQMDKRLGALGSSAANGLITPLKSIASAIKVNDVLAYADAWTDAKNSLAVAGVVGENQAQILDKIYQSAQNNAAPVGAMVELFGKATQASNNLGASQSDLLKFTDGVGTALRVEGKSVGAASGALTQLGQLLGSAHVEAEQFNSINEGAPSILIAVANGLDAAGGSVSKLEQLVNDGAVSNRDFFQSFLNGLPTIQGMAANATQTIEQGVIKVNNAFIRYIGQTDEGLNASQRLVTGLNALADNFDSTADIALQLATILASVLVGRGIGMMLSQVPQLVTAIGTLSTALRTGASLVPALGSALGPLGAIAGLTAGAAIAYGAFSNSVDDATRSLADQASSAGSITGMLEDAKRAQEAYKQAIANTAGVQATNTGSIVASTKREFEAKKALLELELKRQRALLAVQEVELESKSAQLKSDIGSRVFTRNSSVQMGYSDPKIGDFVRLPDSVTGLKATQAAIDANPLTDEIKRIRAESDLTVVSIETLSEALNSSFAGGAVSTNGTGSNEKNGGTKAKFDKVQSAPTAESQFKAGIQAVNDRTAALIQEQEATGKTYFEQEQRRMALDLEKQALADVREEARKNGDENWRNAGISETQSLRIQEVSSAYAEQADVLRRVQEAQQRSQQTAQEFYDTSKSAFSDVVMGAQSFESALSGVLKKLGELALSSAFDGLFGGSSATSSGGWLTGIFKALGFADGGYTGAGGKYEPAGVVHKGEYVFDADAVRKAGGPAGLDAMRKRLKGYSSGGYVGPSAPRMPDLSRAAANKNAPTSVTYAPVIDARGADAEAVSRLQHALAQDRKTFDTKVLNAMKGARARGVKV
ncbi:tape measure protein [Agrobacterium vitis]|uniref:tape measure protein n=1 Tax=Agrobacterium vitis TaxID=373 RepID=UPI0012E8F470|nr:tape measure protein [Agrobacterium vitis]MVA79674.1 tape measure protein [Agrobacterium vitis]